MSTRNRHLNAMAGFLASVVVLAGCSAPSTSPTAIAGPTRTKASIGPVPISQPSPSIGPIPISQPSPTIPSWFDVQMVDVNTDKPFKVSDFAGKVALVETMATWCPTCNGEMSQVQQLRSMYGPGSDLVTITLDVDPNEDATVLKKYAAKYGFDWLIAVAPESVGQFLAKNYDVQYLNPPLQPMLIIDREGGVWGLPFGVKSAISLKQTLDPYLAP